MAAVPVARLFVQPDSTPLRHLAFKELWKVTVDDDRNRVIEQFDKYDILTLPVVYENEKLAGVITADDVISVLRHK